MSHYVNRYVLALTLTLLAESVTAACPDNCKSCDENDHCTSCITGKWDVDNKCLQTCDAKCLNGECDPKNKNCLACNPGLYGLHCQQNCSMCEDGQCDLRVCTKGCKAGYYEYKTDLDTFCWLCSSDCRSCSTTSVCNVCNEGFNLYKYEANGKIVVQCILCSYGPICSSYCAIQSCKQCEIQSDSLLCTQCNDGYRFNGDICIPNDNNCTQGCSTDCDMDGKCLGSCNAGWTGERCSEACTSRCLRCDKNNANICQECKGDYYTEACDVDCNPSCAELSGKQTCRLNDGYCNNGCENKSWGQYCNISCSSGCVDDGVSLMCDRDNGKCRNGCTDEYNGDKCDTIVSKISTVQSQVNRKQLEETSRVSTFSQAVATTSTESAKKDQEEVDGDKNSSFIIGYVSGFGTAVIVAAVAAALYYVRRRYVFKKSKTQKKCQEGTEISTYYNVTAADTRVTETDASNYEQLGNNRNTDKIYSELEKSTVQ